MKRYLDLFSAIQERPKNGALRQGCSFGVAGSDWGFSSRLPIVLLGCGNRNRTGGE